MWRRVTPIIRFTEDQMLGQYEHYSKRKEAGEAGNGLDHLSVSRNREEIAKALPWAATVPHHQRLEMVAKLNEALLTQLNSFDWDIGRVMGKGLWWTELILRSGRQNFPLGLLSFLP